MRADSDCFVTINVFSWILREGNHTIEKKDQTDKISKFVKTDKFQTDIIE